MTRKELLPLLINHYEIAIKRVSNRTSAKTIHTLSEFNVGMGICNCAYIKFRVDIFNKKWVNKYNIDKRYWCEIPYNRKTKKETIASLQFRVDTMKKILSKL